MRYAAHCVHPVRSGSGGCFPGRFAPVFTLVDEVGDEIAYEVFGWQAGFCMQFTETMKRRYVCALSRSARSEWIEMMRPYINIIRGRVSLRTERVD